jgi:hypothetical protein
LAKWPKFRALDGEFPREVVDFLHWHRSSLSDYVLDGIDWEIPTQDVVDGAQQAMPAHSSARHSSDVDAESVPADPVEAIPVEEIPEAIVTAPESMEGASEVNESEDKAPTERLGLLSSDRNAWLTTSVLPF